MIYKDSFFLTSNNKQFFNLRYFSKDPNNNLTLNDIYSGNGMSKSEDKDYFDKLTKCQKLYPCLKLDDLLDCVLMIMEYYEDMDNKSNFNFSIKKKI